MEMCGGGMTYQPSCGTGLTYQPTTSQMFAQPQGGAALGGAAGGACGGQQSVIEVNAPMMPVPQSSAALVDVIQVADRMVEYSLADAEADIIQALVFPAVDHPAEQIINEMWSPELEMILNDRLPIIIEQVMQDIPTMLSEIIDNILGHEITNVLRKIANGTYECVSACYCPDGCTGQQLIAPGNSLLDGGNGGNNCCCCPPPPPQCCNTCQ